MNPSLPNSTSIRHTAIDFTDHASPSSTRQANQETQSQPTVEPPLGAPGALRSQSNRPASPNTVANRPRAALPGELTTTASRGPARMVLDVPLKTQSKLSDCWYASIQMLLSWKNGDKTKPMGESARQHRNLPLVGRKLAFDSAIGGKIMADNGLVAIGDKLELDDADSLAAILAAHGPVILNGKFDPLRQGHLVVLSGVDAATQQVAINDPSWTGGIQWKPIGYLDKIFRTPGSDNVDSFAAVALAASG